MSASERHRNRELERGAAADLWRHTLSQIPSVFGRLVFLSSLRDINSGVYEHHGLTMAFGEEEAVKTLRESHERAFAEWLTYKLEHQKADLDLYMSGISTNKATLLRTWSRLAPHRNFIPASIQPDESALYLGDLEILLGLLRREYGVAEPDPDA